MKLKKQTQFRLELLAVSEVAALGVVQSEPRKNCPVPQSPVFSPAMIRRTSAFVASVLMCGAFAYGQALPESVYAPPELPDASQGINEGAVHFELGVSYFTDYIYRGVEVFNLPDSNGNLNLQIDSKLSIDLGKLPHPYVSLFSNIADNDPTSNFQEIRPSVGFDWEIKPIIVSAGYTSYLYPERDERETQEVFVNLTFDDTALVNDMTVPVPYALLVYDFDKYDGLYMETGVKYRLNFDEIGLRFTSFADVSFIQGYSARINADGGGTEPGFFADSRTTGENIYGFQHYDIGLTGEYSLNKLFNVSTRYGEWSLRGTVCYTGGIDNDIASADKLWGGGGIEFKY